MVFGGRKTMSSMNGHNKSASYDRKKDKPTVNGSSKRSSLPSTNEEDHHAVFFCEDPEFAMYLDDEPDPIVIDFASEFHTRTGHCGFRLASKSLGEQDQLHCCENSPFAPLRSRRAWSEGSLALVPSICTGCPCEAVQGIHSHQSCPKMEMAIPDTCCFTCGSDWALDHTAWACFECGGFGLARPCGKCNGKCGERWNRDLKSTHASGEATWAGNCSHEKENETSNKAKSEFSSINHDSHSQ